MFMIGWTGPFNSMDGTAEMDGFMRTLTVVQTEKDVQLQIDSFTERMLADGEPADSFRTSLNDGWTTVMFMDYAWIAWKEIK